MSDMTESMNLGERRHIKLMIHSVKKEPFAIQGATYELKKLYSEMPEDSGGCQITEHVIDTVVQPKEAGNYALKVNYTIADEVLVDIVRLVVS